MKGRLLPPDAKAMEDLNSKIMDLALKLRDGRKFDVEIQRTRGGRITWKILESTWYEDEAA